MSRTPLPSSRRMPGSEAASVLFEMLILPPEIPAFAGMTVRVENAQ
jgi:hypothetical protein